jgi:hypothetical protein
MTEQAVDRPPIRVLCYGESGSRKSSFAATFPKPLLVLGFDPPDKMTPYTRLGRREIFHDQGFYDQVGIGVTDVIDKVSGEHLVRVEHYGDPDPANPTAYQRFTARVPHLAAEAPSWGTVVLDSITFVQYAHLRWNERVLNPGYKDPRLWYGDLKREMVTQLMSRFVWLEANVVVIAHVSDKKDEFAEGTLRGVNAVGTLGSELPAGYGETYHAVVVRDKDTKEFIYRLQTRSDNLWYSASQIQAPNPCELDYEKLWVEYDKQGG